MHDIPRKPFSFIFEMSKQNKVSAFFALLLTTLGTFFDAITPYFYKRIVDAATASDFDEVWFFAFGYVAIVALMYASWRATAYVGMYWVTGTYEQTYNTLFKYLARHSHTFFSNRFAGSLSTKVTSAADSASGLTEMLVWNYYSNFLSFIITAFLLFTTSVWVGLIFAGLIIVVFSVSYVLMRRQRPKVLAYRREVTKLSGQTVDVATNMAAVRQFARKGYEMNRIGDQVDSVAKANRTRWRGAETNFLVNNVIIVLAALAMVVVMINLYQNGSVTLGDFVMVITLMSSMLGVLTVISRMMNNYVRMYSNVEEGIEEILTAHEVADKDGAKDIDVQKGSISFEDVSFKYDEKNVFEALSLRIKAGEKVGIVGHSGAGKTTLISTLLRHHDVDDGAVLIDEQNIAEVTQDSLRGAISVVPQEPLLFHRSIRDNIRYGNLDSTDTDVELAAKRAQAHDFILEAPDGYETLVGERGIKLSGGQRQRIAIARAFAKNAKILVLDEATSSLDSESESKIQKALHELMEGKTVLAIAHRLSTLKEMDRLIVFEDGKVVQDGTHEELVKEEGSIYQKLWSHQADGFIE